MSKKKIKIQFQLKPKIIKIYKLDQKRKNVNFRLKFEIFSNYLNFPTKIWSDPNFTQKRNFEKFRNISLGFQAKKC